MTTKLLLIRHGETVYTALRKYCGHANAPLSLKGKAQARQLRTKLARYRPSAAYCSDLKRAVQTAGIALRGVKAKRLRQLREMNFGALEGLTHAQALEKYPSRYGKWIKDPSSSRALPRAENAAAFRKRVVRVMEKIAADNPGKSVAVFCHGGPISAFLGAVSGTADIWKFLPEAGGVSVVEYRKGKPYIRSLSRAAGGKTIWGK